MLRLRLIPNAISEGSVAISRFECTSTSALDA
jgi:hypothetical protein